MPCLQTMCGGLIEIPGGVAATDVGGTDVSGADVELDGMRPGNVVELPLVVEAHPARAAVAASTHAARRHPWRLTRVIPITVLSLVGCVGQPRATGRRRISRQATSLALWS